MYYSVCHRFRVHNEMYRNANFLGHILAFAYYSKQTTFEKLRLEHAGVRGRARIAYAGVRAIAYAKFRTEYFIKQNKNSFFYKTL